MRNKAIAIAAMLGIAAILIAGGNDNAIPADPNTVVLRLHERVFYGTDAGDICVEIWVELNEPMGLPDANVPGYTVIGETTTGQPGSVIATRILRGE